MRTDLDVCNLAIGRIGGEPIEALGEDTPLGAFCQTNYPAKRDALLGLYDWRCCNTHAQLAQISPAPPGTPLKYCYAAPADLIGEIVAFRDGAGPDHCEVRCLVSAAGVSSNHAAVWAEYTAAIAEARWPPWLVEFVAVAFAADLAGRRPDRELQARLYAEAFGTPEQNGQGGKFLAAMQADGRNAPQRQLFGGWQPGELIEARQAGNWVTFGLRPIIVDTSNG